MTLAVVGDQSDDGAADGTFADHERLILGWYLDPVNSGAVADRLEEIAFEAFSVPAHQVIYSAIIEASTGGAPDLRMAVVEHLVGDRAPRALNALPGSLPGYLSSCVETAYCLDAGSLAYYINRVNERYRGRRAKALASAYADAIDRGDEARQSWAWAKMGEILDGGSGQAVSDDSTSLSLARRERLFGERLDFYRADSAAKEAHAVEVAERQRAVEGAAPRRSWKPVDLDDVLEGRVIPPQPTVGRRSDGVGMFYPGKRHTISSESEAGKTWLALLAAIAELRAGNSVLYLDFEDDEATVVGRALAMGARKEWLRDRFAYFRPEQAITALNNRDDLRECVQDVKPTLAILDGVTEAMALHGMELKDNTDVANFGHLLSGWLASMGPATVDLDHVVKDPDMRGRYSIGGIHKFNGLNGASYTLQNRDPFGIGLTGRTSVLVGKDRPAQLRKNSLPGQGGLFHFGDFVMTSRSEYEVEAELYPAKPKDDLSGVRPIAVMVRCSRVLAANPGGLSKNAIENLVGGKASFVRTALELLVMDGYVEVKPQGAAKVHVLKKDFTGSDSEAADDQ